ncbi:SSI family serine proteinase inhibitor [Actinoplanes sp. NPDC049681]|uniref:SSI family serine proteinase inhibitor n=1 Tax=Actinoplanes sp. NPDC049681 TaxID=3363905 RepID=UPI0037A924AD
MTPMHHAALLAASVSTTAALLGAGSPAAAAPAASPPDSTLVLAVVPATQSTHPPRITILECAPDGGTHPEAAAACSDLRAVDGNLAAFNDNGGICTKEYQPVIAIAVGTWQGEPVHYRETFSNHCIMLNATGDVFDF